MISRIHDMITNSHAIKLSYLEPPDRPRALSIAIWSQSRSRSHSQSQSLVVCIQLPSPSVLPRSLHAISIYLRSQLCMLFFFLLLFGITAAFPCAHNRKDVRTLQNEASLRLEKVFLFSFFSFFFKSAGKSHHLAALFLTKRQRI